MSSTATMLLFPKPGAQSALATDPTTIIRLIARSPKANQPSKGLNRLTHDAQPPLCSSAFGRRAKARRVRL